MANISDARGSMKLKGDWMPELIEKLNTISQTVWTSWHYDISIDPFETKKTKMHKPVSLCGSGRCIFETNLNHAGQWTAEDINEEPELAAVYNTLLAGMHEKDLSIKVSYTNAEPGCMVLYRQTGVMSSDGTALVYTINSNKSYKYNWKNYLELYDDCFEFEELVEDLFDHTELDIDQIDLIEQWAMKRTLPLCSEFNHMSDATQAEFLETFGKPAEA